MEPLISIITINRNNRLGLQSTVRSVIEQNTKSFEYIIIDGCSTDGSVGVIHQYDEFINYWVSEKDNGVYHAMNKGIKHAKGKYLMFLNSGDTLFNSTVVSELLKSILEYKYVDIFYGDVFMFNSLHKELNEVVKKMPADLDILFFKNNTINHQASLFKNSLFKEFGFYPEEYKMASDYWLYLNSLIQNKDFFYLNLPIVKYDMGGISAKSFDKYENEMKDIWEKVLPKIILDISKKNDELVAENKRLKAMTNYKLVNLAIRLNKIYQNSKL